MSKRTLLFLVCAIFLSGCYTKLPVLAVRVENDRYTFKKECRLVEKEIKGKEVTVTVCTVVRVPTNEPDSNPVTAAQIQSILDSANDVWSKYDYEFSFAQNADYITWHDSKLNRTPASASEWEDYARRANALALLANPEMDKVVVLFRNEGGMGWSWGPENTNYVSMPGNNYPYNKFLDHELGHYFGLVHTFNYDDCSKLTLANTDNDINGMLTASTNDDIGDTASDPTKKCLTANFCSDTTITINSVVFNPPLHNVMSYYGCTPLEFSPDQLKAIKYNLQNGRTNIPVIVRR